MSVQIEQLSTARRPDAVQPVRKPRLGFLGVGWIGRHRLQAVSESRLAEIAVIADAALTCLREAAVLACTASQAGSLEELLEHELDGVVIATPSAFHASQALTVLERGIPVFCQKPLARTAAETRAIIDAARAHDCLLGVDLSYRHVKGVEQMRELVRSGALGRVYAADLTFHNAYGPDKPWFYDPQLSGGGCVMDLGTHLIDLALWMLGFPEIEEVNSQLFSRGMVLEDCEKQVEDYAVASLRLAGDLSVRLACSWRLPAGCDAVIQAQFFGTEGAVSLKNVNGSFYDFQIERYSGTSRQEISGPPDAWGGRAIIDWVQRLAQSEGYNRDADHFVDVAAALDRIYQRCTC